ncbi:hypothetical protein BX283_0696 [Streptomyces sp. TLI_146]|nr:hypothetical protein BX283_0696 [Streptomyces sp. TLI_146]
MRWTDDSGTAYGENPDGDAGYTYVYSREYGGGFVPDTSAQPWDARQTAQWTPPQAHTSSAWEPACTDTLTAQLPVLDTPEQSQPQPQPQTDIPPHESGQPVFVDASGRRQRHVFRAAGLLMIPAVGYVALLTSTILGGPTINSPIFPKGAQAHPAAPSATAPGSPTATAPTSKTPTRKSPGTTVRRVPGPSGRPVSAVPAPAARRTSAPTASAAPTATAAPAPSPKGRAVGSSHKPVK